MKFKIIFPKPPNSEAPGAAAPAPAWEAAPAMASSVATAVATGPTRERWKCWNASDDYLVKWLVGLFGLVSFVLAWFCCWSLFCLLLFVCLVGWLLWLYCIILYLIALIGWGHKGIFELDEDPGRLGSDGSPMKLIDPSILSELAIDVERDLNRNGK